MNGHYRASALMSEYAVHLQPGFILHHRNYKETSLILDVLTEDFGKVSLLAKGVRKAKSKTLGLLQPFVPLRISYLGKSELKTLSQVEIKPPLLNLKGIPLYCGFYVNDLAYHFLYQYDPHPEVFWVYRECLAGLAQNQSIEEVLRLFEISLLEYTGYGLQLEQDSSNGKPIEPGKQYEFNADIGPVESGNGQFSGTTIIALRARQLSNDQVLAEAKRLMRSVIDFHLQGKKLKSRELISKIIKLSLDQDK